MQEEPATSLSHRPNRADTNTQTTVCHKHTHHTNAAHSSPIHLQTSAKHSRQRSQGNDPVRPTIPPFLRRNPRGWRHSSTAQTNPTTRPSHLAYHPLQHKQSHIKMPIQDEFPIPSSAQDLPVPNSPNAALFVCFISSTDPATRQPWCPDVRAVLPRLQRVFEREDAPRLVYVHVGQKPEYVFFFVSSSYEE